jgi:hypothetical protein
MAINNEIGPARVPPYVPYKTFLNFLDHLGATKVPGRIDRSAMGHMSGSAQAQVTHALRFFGLISDAGVPDSALEFLAEGPADEKKQQLRTLLESAYPSLLGSDFPLDRATHQQLQEAFIALGASGDTLRKCQAFFIAAAEDAGITISPHIKKRRVLRTPRRAAGRPPLTSKPPKPKNGGGGNPPLDEGHGGTPFSTWHSALLSKFPELDPSWPDDVKAKWFDAFQVLMQKGGSG